MKNWMLAADTLISKEEIKEQGNFFINYLKGLVPDALDFCVDVILAIMIYLVGVKVISLLRKMARKVMERSRLDEGVKQFLDSFLKMILYFLLIVIIVTKFGVTTASVTAVVGSAGLALGLALQGSLSNFAGGVLLLILKPFEVGDYIVTESGKEGTVNQIQICYTKLLTVDNTIVVIPNGKLADGVITNVTKQEKRRVDLKVGIAYDADLKLAKRTLEELMNAEAARLPEEPVNVYVDHLGESDVVLGARIWVKTEDYWPTKWKLQEEILLSFNEAGIKIPFPQMEITISKTEKGD